MILDREGFHRGLRTRVSIGFLLFAEPDPKDQGDGQAGDDDGHRRPARGPILNLHGLAPSQHQAVGSNGEVGTAGAHM